MTTPDQTMIDSIKANVAGTGVFLEADTYRLYKNWPDKERVFSVWREYPYNSSIHQETRSGTVDVLAETGAKSLFNGSVVLILPIECKKADPRLKHWVFEPHRAHRPSELLPFLSIAKDSTAVYLNDYLMPSLGYERYEHFENAVNLFEFNEKDGKPGQTDKQLRAYYAIKQVAESVRGLKEKLTRISRNTEFPNFILPIVVTTANLWVMDYDSKDVNKETGEIDTKKLDLKSKDWVLQGFPNDYIVPDGTRMTDNRVISPDYAPVFVVRATKLQEFTQKLINELISNIG